MAVVRGRTQIPLTTTGSDPLCGPPLTDVPLTEADAATLASVLAALADPVRLRLLSILAAQGEVCSCHLQEPLGKSQPTISHHTRVLAQAGLIEGDRRGKWTWWRIVPERLADLRQALGGT
jgi:ArsR family transcriptional regulator